MKQCVEAQSKLSLVAFISDTSVLNHKICMALKVHVTCVINWKKKQKKIIFPGIQNNM